MRRPATQVRAAWDKVCDAVEHVVTFGLEHRTPGQIDAIGVDEIQYAKGEEITSKIVFVCSDIWEPYLKVIREKMAGKQASSNTNRIGSWLGPETGEHVAGGLYARVSTTDQQTLPMQNRAMREHAARRGWVIACKSVRSVPGRRNEKLGRNYGRPRAAGRSTWSWRGPGSLGSVSYGLTRHSPGTGASAQRQADQVRKLYRDGVSKAEIARRAKMVVDVAAT